MMVEQVHDHILEELRTNTRTDTVFVLAAILLNLVGLAVNAAVAAPDEDSARTMIVMGLMVTLIVVVNLVAAIGLMKGRQTRAKLLSGLIKMYKENGVDGYYDVSLLDTYKLRYVLFIIAVLTTGAVAIALPFVL
jgi:hypothetical protein